MRIGYISVHPSLIPPSLILPSHHQSKSRRVSSLAFHAPCSMLHAPCSILHSTRIGNLRGGHGYSRLGSWPKRYNLQNTHTNTIHPPHILHHHNSSVLIIALSLLPHFSPPTISLKPSTWPKPLLN